MTTTSNMVYRRLAVAIIGLVTALFTIAWHAGSASADAYPPPVSTCTATAPATAGAAVKSCGVDSVNVHKTPHTSDQHTTKHSSDLASTGFQTATALAIVVAFLAVGGLCLYAGSRRRRS